jgi:hypothetical protein
LYSFADVQQPEEELLAGETCIAESTATHSTMRALSVHVLISVYVTWMLHRKPGINGGNNGGNNGSVSWGR